MRRGLGKRGVLVHGDGLGEELERRAALLAALEQLSEEHRLVVTYRYLLEMDERETAEALGWPRGTVKSRLHRALGRLRDQLGTEHGTEVTHGG